MRKIKLLLEDLDVESFQVTSEDAGSVVGYQFLGMADAAAGVPATVSCAGTCGHSCPPCDSVHETCTCLPTAPEGCVVEQPPVFPPIIDTTPDMCGTI
jgi:hypothetical protein